jgi:hypothetical protein
MIISASRRTDIPAFYSAWLMNRIRAGWVAVPNPVNHKQVATVSLMPGDVDAIVFWTRDARPLMPHLRELETLGHRFYFQYTVTGYPRLLEPHTPSLADAVQTLRLLSDLVGPRRVVWRYDPILFSDNINEAYHLKRFDEICSKLTGYSIRCVISFLDFYRKARTNLARLEERVYDLPQNTDLLVFTKKMAEIGNAYGFQLATCAELLALEDARVWPGRCVDGDLIRELFGIRVDTAKDAGQRDACGCIRSRDIGMYDSCLHGCAYCYANVSLTTSISRARTLHNPNSASLLGWTEPVCGARHPASRQLELFQG